MRGLISPLEPLCRELYRHRFRRLATLKNATPQLTGLNARRFFFRALKFLIPLLFA